MEPTMHHSKSVLNAYGLPFLFAINSLDAKDLTQLAAIASILSSTLTSTFVSVYNRVFWHTLARAQNNNYKNQIKK